MKALKENICEEIKEKLADDLNYCIEVLLIAKEKKRLLLLERIKSRGEIEWKQINGKIGELVKTIGELNERIEKINYILDGEKNETKNIYP